VNWPVRFLAVALAAAACSQDLRKSGETPTGAAQAGFITSPPRRLSTVRVTTQHNDPQRTGANLNEDTLTPANVGARSFGLLFTLPVDGQVYAQPLYMGSTQVADSTKGGATTTANVVYVATMNNTVYAFDADSERAPYWTTNTTLGRPDTGHQPNIWSTGHVPDQQATFGILSTPVIDANAGVLYVVARSKLDCALGPTPTCGPGSPGNDAQYQLYRIDIVTGHVLAATVLQTPKGANPAFDANIVLQRPALLLAAGRVFIAFGSQFECNDGGPGCQYHGWVFAYDAAFAANAPPADILCTTPSSKGGGIWHAGNGLTADSSERYLYFMTGNGWAGTNPPAPNQYQRPAPGDLQDSFVRVPLRPRAVGSPVFGVPEARPSNRFYDVEIHDLDLGSSGPVLLPGGRLLGGGKPALFYVLDAEGAFGDTQAPFQAFVDSYRDPAGVTDYSTTMGPHIHGGPIVWSLPSNPFSYVYGWSERDHLRRFDYDNVQRTIAPPHFPYNGIQGVDAAPEDKMPGGALSLSANGAQLDTGIVWAVVENTDALWGPRSGYFEAYSAQSLGYPIFKEFIPMFSKFAAPTVANAHVYLPTFQYQVRVYGLRQLSQAPATWDTSTFSFCSGTDHELLSGDFNGDGRADLLCHGRVNGELAVALADGNGHYASVVPGLANGCANASEKLYVGDFDGDAHSDVYCHNTQLNNADWIAYADAGGVIGSPVSQPSNVWCYQSDEEIHIGDFNGDGRDDLLCHRHSSGEKYIRFTDHLGMLRGQASNCGVEPNAPCDWYQPIFGWCTDANDELYVGDFNGDQHADLLCHTAWSSATKWIIEANPDGSFPGTPSPYPPYLYGTTTAHDTLNNGWCISSPDGYGRLAVADFNADGIADTYCHGDNGGGQWVDYTIAGPPILYPPGSSIVGNQTWCYSSPGWISPEVIVADVDGDKRADVVCHDRTTGRIGVEYSPLSGIATDVACGPGISPVSGCWMLGWERGYSGGYLIYQQVAGDWVLRPGAAVDIDVGPFGPWVVNDSGWIFAWTGSDWARIPGGASDVGVGADGSVWIVGTTKIVNDYEVWRWNGSTFIKYPGGGVRIDVGPDGLPWLVNSNGQIFHWDGATWTELSSGVYAYDIGVGADGSVYIVERNPSMTIAKWNGSGWTPIAGDAGLRVTVRADGKPMFIPLNGGLPITG
jgi:hypothetical protein